MPHIANSDALEYRARSIVESLGGVWRRGKGMCCCPAHDDRTPSLSVSLGRKAILFHCFAGCSNAEVIAALDRGGIRPRELFDGTGAPPAERPADRLSSRNALRLWRAAVPIAQSPAERYLARRGLQRTSNQLRFLAHTPLGPKGAVRFLPAMLAAVTDDTGVIAVHRTFLNAPDGTLAAFERPKRALGSLDCGAVRLAPPALGRLGLAEGIESALAAMELFDVPCWASLGNERFGLIAIPESVCELHLFIDNDAGGALAEERARKAYAGVDRVILSRVPAATGWDWNDELRARRPQTA